MPKIALMLFILTVQELLKVVKSDIHPRQRIEICRHGWFGLLVAEIPTDIRSNETQF